MKNIRLTFLLILLSSASFAKDKISYFTTSDSIEIGYLQIGDRALPNLIFVHGGPGDNSSDFRVMAVELSKDYCVTVYDSRGCGFSQRGLSNQQLTIEKMVVDLTELLNHLSLKSAHILGHSYGGAVAMEFGLKYPEKVDKLILCNPVVSVMRARRNRMENSYQTALQENDTMKINVYNRYISGDSITIWDEFKMVDASHSWYNPNTMDSVSKTIRHRKLGYSKKTMAGAFYIVVGYYETGFFLNYSILERINELKCKVLIIAGSHDKLISVSDLTDLNDLISTSQMVVIEKCGHSPYLERPEEFQRAVKNFL